MVNPTIEVLELKNLPPAQLEGFSKLQFTYLKSSPHPMDLFDPKNRLTYAIGASIDGVPVGLMLMFLSIQNKVADLQSLFVAESYRRQGIGSRMVQFAVEQLQSVDFNYIFAVYPDGWEESVKIESFLEKNGFSGKRLAIAEFVFEYSTFKPAWFARCYQWGKKLQVFPWKELTFYEAVVIKERFMRGDLSTSLYPFHGDGAFEPMNSLGLRYDGQLIGWMVTERVSPTIVNYKNLFIDFEFQKKGYSIQLLVDALNIHYRHQVKWGMFKINVLQTSGNWIKFVRRRLAPNADFIFEYYQYGRNISKK